MPSRIQVCLSLHDRHDDGIKTLSERTGLSKSELVRRMLDHSFQEVVLNQLVPSLSGSLQVNGR